MEKHLAMNHEAIYSDVVNGGHILPKKSKYTMGDFKRLVAAGWEQLDARFIVLCSAAYHHAETSKVFGTEKFLIACETGIAIL